MGCALSVSGLLSAGVRLCLDAAGRREYAVRSWNGNAKSDGLGHGHAL